MILIGWGTFGEVYLFNKNNISSAIKTSYILGYVSKLIKEKPIEIDQITIFTSEYDNEINQILSFAYLSKVLPNNYVKIFDIQTIFLNNYDFPLRLIYMEYVNGINMHKFISMFDDMDYLTACFSIISQLLLALMYSNINGFFHNDLNLGNIMIKRVDNVTALNFNIGNKHIILENKKKNAYIPVIIDYNFSKKIVFTNKYPIDCYIIFEYLCEKLLNISYVTTNQKYKNTKLLFLQLSSKYAINCTPFIEKIITGRGLFSVRDYANLPKISNEDIDQLSSCFAEMYE
jgi:serine/threonine protein kinase